jgi:hypothetical protein
VHDRSDDGGDSWLRVSDGIPSSTAVRSLLIDPVDTSVLFAGVTESGGGGGVYKTSDSGVTWARYGDLPDVEVWSLAIDSGGSWLHAGTSVASVYDVRLEPSVGGREAGLAAG